MKILTTSILIIALVSISLFSIATDYTGAMKKLQEQLKTAQSKEEWLNISQGFERIASNEAKKWQPSYWAAYAYIRVAQREKEVSKKDAILDKADEWIEKGLKINATNDELLILKAMSAQARLPVDPMSRWMKYGPIIGMSLEQAKKINASNPRIYLINGENIYFTPKEFGGGKSKALPLFEQAEGLYKDTKIDNDFLPKWGIEELNYFIEQCKK
jgi:hypothetical protein